MITEAPFNRRAHPQGARFFDWRAPDGWLHRRMDWPQPRGRKARGTLLFAGGRGDFIEKYLEAMAHWHGQGWHVAAFDWRGQGASRGDSVGGHLDSLDILVEDLAALVEDVPTQGPLVVVGHSMGGHVLLRALAEGRVKPDAAVLVAPMLMINTAMVPPWAAWSTAALMSGIGWGRTPAWRARDEGRGQRRQVLTSCPQRFADELHWWREQPGFNIGAPSWGWIDAAYRSCAQLTEDRLRGIDTPLLFVATEADRLVAAGAIRRAAAIVPDARLKMFDDAKHEILRESDRLRLQAHAAIDAFLDEIVPR
jgi:lysophospholipase